MRSLIRYLIKNHAFVLFVLLEAFALTMVFNYNSFQRAKYLNSANKVTGKIYSVHQSVTGYFGLTKANRELAEENARLHYLLESYSGENSQSTELLTIDFPEDSTIRFIPAMVINNSVNRPFNYITLNKGSRHGIKPDQGIISARGVVGVVSQVSESYAMGLSLLNQRWSVSSKLKKNEYFGSLVWQGGNYRMAGLTEIPLHVDIAIGDTIVTSGYSSIFPEGFLIGTISSFDRPDGDNYYSIHVELAVDFKALGHVEVVYIQDKDEIIELERRVRDDQVAD